MANIVVASKTEWVDKKSAAAALGTSEKTIERMVQRGKLRQKDVEVPGVGRRPTYAWADIEKMRNLKRAPELPQSLAVQRPAPQPPPMQFVALTPKQFEALIPRAGSMEDLSRKVYLTTEEAVQYTGLSRKQLAECDVTIIGSRPKKYRRADLDLL